ncbi:unnamed protein product [Cylindrotheca closterium]|uniref:Toprim domain-containing protein n=1 Tax=Cylindrotheca closterium TaxID=2856 RepID=A0AAD2GBX4_9STRA|nr:unnamed protein product [Cylindrotheca closterium]
MICTLGYSTFFVAVFLLFNRSLGWTLSKQNQYGRRLTASGNRNSALSARKPSTSFIPTEQIEELREAVDLVSVVESYNLPQFKRNGGRATCLCPFHDDHNPSLSIDGSRGIYKCFSCGAGGNVYNFIQEYARLDGEEIPFPRAVEIVKQFAPAGVGPSLDFKVNSKDSPYNRAQKAKKERLVQANLAAAAYFEKSLVSMAGAGKARAYLRGRKLNPTTIRAFSIGYAPDCYFERKENGSRSWGEGSLVNYLKEQSFTAQEIFDAGLATKTNAKGERKQTTEKNQTDIQYSNIMDRFRGRIIVPIFDARGKSVIGFGGRILDTFVTNTEFKVAKYLNSPESLIFKKQQILFGQHMAKKSVRFWANKAVDDANHPVVIVEGYMDVIALWQAGIREGVASMGTSLTVKQLNAVAALAGRKNGHVVLCLDNDIAGLTAIERLCSGRTLHDLIERYPLEIRVASLPAGIKDPAEFIEDFVGEENIVEAFRTEIIAGAIEWSDWYIKRVLASYNPASSRGATGSFGDVFDRVAAFLANYKNAADRTKQACEVAGHLGSIIATSDNNTQVSNAVLIQLESDLVEKAASIAQSKSGTSVTAALSSDGKSSFSEQLSNLLREDRNLGVDERNKLSTKALRQREEVEDDRQEQFVVGSTNIIAVNKERSLARGSRFKMKRASDNKVPDLSPHFKGFDFLSETDVKWLGLADEKGRIKKYLLPKGAFNKFGEINEFGQKKPIYFNSNDYHGNQFLTAEAMLAGYKDDNARRDPEIFTKGIALLLERDVAEVWMDAEDSLLHMLVLYAPARKAIKTILHISDAAQSGDALEWSSSVKQWLFHVLVNEESSIPSHINGPSDKGELHTYLRRCIASHDISSGSDSSKLKEDIGMESAKVVEDLSWEELHETATTMSNLSFSIEGSNHSNEFDMPLGTTIMHGAIKAPKPEEIDFIFDPKFDPPDLVTLSVYDDEMLRLSAQQVYSALLLASAQRKLSFLQSNLVSAVNLLHDAANETAFLEEDVSVLLSIDERIQIVNGTVRVKEMKELCGILATKIGGETQAISRIAESNNRLSQRLSDLALSKQIEEGEISTNDYESLRRRLDEHMLEIAEWSLPTVSDEFRDEEPYEDTLERAQLSWGRLFDDEYMWSIKDAREVPLVQKSAAADSEETREPGYEESLDEFNARIEKSWGWLDHRDDVKSGDDDDEDESRLYTFDQEKWDDLLNSSEEES